MARSALPVCQALLPDRFTRCTRTIKNGPGPFCTMHGKEYVTLTNGYKALSAQNDELVLVDLTDNELRMIKKVSDLDWLIQKQEDCVASFQAEITARETHHIRFFGKVDPGHANWLYRVDKRRLKAVDQLAKLQRRRAQLAPRYVAATKRAIPESGRISTRQVLPTRDDDVGDAVIACTIIAVCVVLCGFLWLLLSSDGRASTWIFLRGVLASMPILLQYLLWGTKIILLICWEIATILFMVWWRTVVVLTELLSNRITFPLTPAAGGR
ncbi:hypothetical protein C8Q77DRAFT_358795 [Trametes polyzona]|nr:hypothetical protein C8Q77DRAFT_358795 [Trametes polyzona]